MENTDPNTANSVLKVLCCVATSKGKITSADLSAISMTLASIGIAMSDERLKATVHGVCKSMHAKGVDSVANALLPVIQGLSDFNAGVAIDEGIDRLLEVSATPKALAIAEVFRERALFDRMRSLSEGDPLPEEKPKVPPTYPDTGTRQPTPVTTTPAAPPSRNLRPCPDCGANVSKRAPQCPQCGSPLTPALPDSIFAEVVASGVVSTNIGPPLLMQTVHQVFMDYGTSDIQIQDDNLSITGRAGPGFTQLIEAVMRTESDRWIVAFYSSAPGMLTDWGKGGRDRQKLPELLVTKLKSLSRN